MAWQCCPIRHTTHMQVCRFLKIFMVVPRLASVPILYVNRCATVHCSFRGVTRYHSTPAPHVGFEPLLRVQSAVCCQLHHRGIMRGAKCLHVRPRWGGQAMVLPRPFRAAGLSVTPHGPHSRYGRIRTFNIQGLSLVPLPFGLRTLERIGGLPLAEGGSLPLAESNRYCRSLGQVAGLEPARGDLNVPALPTELYPARTVTDQPEGRAVCPSPWPTGIVLWDRRRALQPATSSTRLALSI